MQYAQKLLKTVYTSLTKELNIDGDQFKSLVLKKGKHLNMIGKDIFSPIRTSLYEDGPLLLLKKPYYLGQGSLLSLL